MKFYIIKIFHFGVVVLSSVFILSACDEPDPYKDVRVRASDTPEVAFKKYSKFIERKILEHSELEDAKKKYGIKKWGESLKADIKNPLVQLSTGECFDLREIADPWFVSHIYTNKAQKEKPALSQSNSQFQMIEYFDIDARMRDLKLPFLDTVESDIFIDRLQEYMYVRVTSKPALVFYHNAFDPEDSFIDYRSRVKEGVWKPVSLELLELGEWKFDWYVFQPYQGSITILADLSKQAVLLSVSWDAKTNTLAHHTESGYPINIGQQLRLPLRWLYSIDEVNKKKGFIRHDGWSGRPPVSIGRRVYDMGYGYRIMFSTLSTPHTAKIFFNVDAVIEKIKIECN